MSEKSSVKFAPVFDPKWQLVHPDCVPLLRETAATTEEYKDILGTDKPLLQLDLSEDFNDITILAKQGYVINWEDTKFKDPVTFLSKEFATMISVQENTHDKIVSAFNAIVLPNGNTFGSQLFITDTYYVDEYDSDVNFEESVMVATQENVEQAGFDLSHLTR